jgi:hypothetical protein
LVDEIPPLPLNEPVPLEQDSTWINQFGDGPPPAEVRATLTRLGEDDLEITTPHRFVDGVSELIFADAEGRFSASWCSWNLAFASLVLPQIDETGAPKELRTIPMLDLAGRPLGAPALEAMKHTLAGTHLLPDGHDEPVIHVDTNRYPATEVVGLLFVETDREWDERFSCFDAGNRFGSQSSHASPCTGGVIGHAEMFTWHPAAMRLAWDLRPEGDHESDPIPVAVGASFRRGGIRIEIAGIENGEFRRSNGGRNLKHGDPAHYVRVKDGAVARTAFLVGSFPGDLIRRIEGRPQGGAWEELPFTPEPDGVLAIDLPEEGRVSELRVIRAPGRLRVVVDVPSIGGGLPENAGIKTYNEVAFRLHQNEIENGGIDWRLWQLTGRYPKIESERYQQLRGRRVAVDPGKLYRASELLEIWRELNPELRIDWDPSLGTLVVKDR